MADALSKQDFLAHANALHRHADDLINESGYGDDDDDEDMDEDDCRSAADKASTNTSAVSKRHTRATLILCLRAGWPTSLPTLRLSALVRLRQ
jgi:hypothetical protein